jgi:myxalamid-type polyketide synthase MxaE and MxaD
VAWTLHATGTVRHEPSLEPGATWDAAALAAVRARAAQDLSGTDFYRLLADKGNDWGPAFQGVAHVWRTPTDALSRVEIVDTLRGHYDRYRFHPAVSDACGHALAAIPPLDQTGPGTGGAFVGGSIGEVRQYRRPQGTTLWCYARVRPSTAAQDNVIVGDVQVIDESGAVVSETLDAHLWYLDREEAHAQASVDSLLYSLDWEDRPLAEHAAEASATIGTTLVFGDPDGLGTSLAHHLRGYGATVTVAPRGASAAVLDDLASAGAATVVYLGGLDDASDNHAADLVTGALDVVQRLARTPATHAARVWLATRGAQPVGGTPGDNPRQATLWGLGRTIALEHSELWGGLLDLDPEADADSAGRALAEELAHGDGEDQIAWRGGRRFVARLTRLQVPAGERVELRGDATTLITGGLGGLGLEVAQFLASRGARHLALLGRRGRDGATDAQRAALAALEASGVQVSVLAADVADEAHLRAALADLIAAGAPPVRGVVHAAGVLEHQALLDATPADVRAAMRAKVEGGALLDRLLPDLDFFVLFSSASALLSSPRLASYAAANAYLDALAHARRGAGKPALSIDWGVWSEAGMAMRFERRDVATLGDRGMGTLTNRQALAAFERLLGSDLPQAAVLPVDWQRWQQLYPAFVAAPLLTRIVQPLATGAAMREAGPSGAAILAARGQERAELLEQYIVAQAARVLGLDSDTLDRDQPLGNFGLDSLMAVELKNAIETDLTVVVPMVRFLEGPTSRELSTFVLGLLDQAEVAPDANTANVEDMSEAEVDRMLRELLANS